MKNINAYSDPGHGSAKVKRQELIDLGIADKISSYSYQLNDNVYLEEDCDLSIYIDALLNVKGITRDKIKFTMHNTNRQSRIRTYENYYNKGSK